MFRRLLSLMFFGAAIGLTAGLVLGAGSIAYKALAYNNKKDKKFDYNSYGYSQYADKSNAFILS